MEKPTADIGNQYFMEKLPFIETKLAENIFIREFDVNTDSIEYSWHRDKEDRTISSIDKTDWLFQMDENIPTLIENEIFIPKGIYHRIIKGTNNLKIKLIKHK